MRRTRQLLATRRPDVKGFQCKPLGGVAENKKSITASPSLIKRWYKQKRAYTIWSTDKRVRHRWRKTWSTLSTMAAGNGPCGPCRSSQCLSWPGWRLKLGQRGARRPENLRANCGADVKGEWQAGGATMAKNGLSPDEALSIKFNASSAWWWKPEGTHYYSNSYSSPALFSPSKYFIDLQGIERPPLSDGFYESLDESVDVSTLLRSYKTITAQADRFIREKGSPAALN